MRQHRKREAKKQANLKSTIQWNKLLEKLNSDVNDEPDFIWTSPALFGSPLTLEAWACCPSLSAALAVQVVVVPKEEGVGELALKPLHTPFLVLDTQYAYFVAS